MSNLSELEAGSRRNTDIECLRAVAVVGVVFHHAQGNLFHPGLAWLSGFFQHADFWFGVDLFFAISGFVIARSLLPQMAEAERSFKQQMRVIGAFWIRRFWRLLPSAWLWLGVILLATLMFNRSGAFGTVHANVMATVAGLLDVANFRFADAFFRYEYGASFVYWSLSLEEQFYLLLPLMVAMVRRYIGWVMIGVFLLQLYLFRTPMLMSIRTDALALGVLLAVAAPGRVYAAIEPLFLLRAGLLRVAVPVLILSALAILAAADMQTWRFRISAIAVLCATLAWLASYDQDYLLPKGILKRVLVWIGARSYAIYLIHIPVYFGLREIGFLMGHAGAAGVASLAPPGWLLAALAAGIIALLADVNYRYLEQPLRRHGRKIAGNFLRGPNARSPLIETAAGAPVAPVTHTNHG